MTGKTEALFESYNTVIEGSYNKAFMNSENGDPFKVKEGAVLKYLEADISEWERTPIQELGSRTPGEYLESIDDLETLMELFKAGAVLCDRDLPVVLTNRLFRFGEMAENYLLEMAKCVVKADDADAYYIFLMSIRTLGIWKSRKAVSPLLDILRGCDDSEEQVMEEIQAAFVNIGLQAEGQLVEELNRSEEIDLYHEYILLALADIGKYAKSDAVYRCLKNAFLKMENKIIGASALANYGDGRAVPALRGVIERNKETIDAETFYELKTAVENLGGSIDDIAIPRFKKGF